RWWRPRWRSTPRKASFQTTKPPSIPTPAGPILRNSNRAKSGHGPPIRGRIPLMSPNPLDWIANLPDHVRIYRSRRNEHFWLHYVVDRGRFGAAWAPNYRDG